MVGEIKGKILNFFSVENFRKLFYHLLSCQVIFDFGKTWEKIIFFFRHLAKPKQFFFFFFFLTCYVRTTTTTIIIMKAGLFFICAARLLLINNIIALSTMPVYYNTILRVNYKRNRARERVFTVTNVLYFFNFL